jgi:adenine-specific DNA glycosylase
MCFAFRPGLALTVGAKTPLATEQQLMKYVPKALVHKFHHWLVLHGRYVCTARKPKCGECGLRPVCRYYRKCVVQPKATRVTRLLKASYFCTANAHPFFWRKG